MGVVGWDGIVRVTDRPANQGGRAYLVERELQTKSELDALIADYLLCRGRHGRYYADRLNMLIEAVVSVGNRDLACAL